MNRVVIIDDDNLVRISLKMMIDWEAEGFNIVGEAVNGENGLALIKELKPDMAIIDIKMPTMDGLTLSQEISKLDQELYYIMLSNYDEYEYVRGAMKNGAKDFLLKHKLNEETLREQLENAKDLLAKREDQRENYQDKDGVKEDFILALLVGDLKSKTAVIEHRKKYNLAMGIHKVVPIIMVIDGYKKSIEEKGMDYLYKLRKNVGFTLKEILATQQETLFTQVEDNKYVILASYDGYRSEKQIYEQRYQMLRHIQEQIQLYYNESVSFSIGDLVPLHQMKASYVKAYQRLKVKFYMGFGVVVDERNSYPLYQINGQEFLEKKGIKKIQLTESLEDPQGLECKVQQFFKIMRMEKINHKSTLDILHLIVEELVKKLEAYGIPANCLFTQKSPKEQFKVMETWEELADWLLGRMVKFNALCRGEEKELSPVVRQAKSHIRQYYHEPINLTSTADEIGVNSTYLSKVFKDEMAVGFNQYLSQLRIQHAKELMDQGEELKIIADKCGFQDYAYFSKVFKRQEGYPPSQYTHLKKEQSI